MTGKSFFVYAQKFSAGLCIFPLQSSALLFCHTQPDIKEMAKRAVWLGNDETHYVRKWEDKDIQDLKNLIDLTVYFISMTLKAKKYREEMAM